ncbi:MAG TPA: DMT family transporter [Ktedonobacteraceae bacterium]|nr:DMT family transporter [Ktedonobacteraceae bacterium]
MDTVDNSSNREQGSLTHKPEQKEKIKNQVQTSLSSSKNSLLIIAAAFLYIVLWGSAFTATKIGITYSPPLTLLAERFLASSLLMALLAWVKRLRWPQGWLAWGRLALFGLLNSAIFLGCNYEAQRTLSAGMGSIISATNPLLLALVAPFLLKERLIWYRILGLILGFGGVVFVMEARLHEHGQLDSAGGMVLSFIGTISFVVATLFYKRYPPREHAFVVNAVQLGAAGLVLIIPALLSEHPEHIPMNAPLIESFLYLVLVISIGASLLWFWLLQRGEASAVSSYYFLTPIVGLALAALLLGEPFGLREVLGMIAIATGIALINNQTLHSFNFSAYIRNRPRQSHDS